MGVDGDELIQQVEYEINKYNDKMMCNFKIKMRFSKTPKKINNLKIITSNSDQVHLFTGDSFIQGDLVEVVKGPFMGLYAKCILLQGKHRVIVSVQGVDNIFEVNVPLSFLQKLKSV